MATGDTAASAGLPVVSPTSDIRMGYDAINQLADGVGTHILSGGHAISKIVGLTSALAEKATVTALNALSAVVDTHATQIAALSSALNTKAGKPGAGHGDRAVGDVTGANRIGLRWNGNNGVLKVDDTERELASRTELLAINNNLQSQIDSHSADINWIVSRLNAHGI